MLTSRTIPFQIRRANRDDALALCQFTLQLNNESEFLLYDMGERKSDLEKMQCFLEKLSQNSKSVILIAEIEGQGIIGFLCAENIALQRISHLAKMNMGVLKNYQQMGVATQLGLAMVQHARQVGITRLEATVIKENRACVALFQKFGFVIEGEKKNSIKIKDQFYNEYMIACVM